MTEQGRQHATAADDRAASRDPISKQPSFLVSLWQTAKSQTEALREKQRQRTAERLAAIQEAKAKANTAKFMEVFKTLEDAKNVINPASWTAIEKYAMDMADDSDALGQFASHTQVTDLLKYVESRQAFLKRDLERQTRTYVFERSCDSFFSAIGYSTATPILKSILRKYQISNAGNIVASGIFGGQRNVGGVAYSMTQAARVGAHNGDASAAFLSHMPSMIFMRSAADISDLHRHYINYAHRLIYFNCGDESLTSRALFCLIYDNGNATAKPPTVRSRFSGNLHAEFHNNFLPYFWTVKQAAAQLDEIRKEKAFNERLFQEKDATTLLRSWRDEVPKPGFHLTNGTDLK